MKTKNMRRKALVSSVAMLLVAVVALSGATFAWWSTNSTATVTGTEISTQRGASLQLLEKTVGTDTEPSGDALNGYTSALTVSWVGSSFEPCSTTKAAIKTPTFSKVTAVDNEVVDTDSQKVASISNDASGNVLHKQLWLKSTTAVDVALAGLTITGTPANQSTIAPAMRVAIKQGGTAHASDDYVFFSSASKTYRGIVKADSGSLPADTTFAQLYSATEVTGTTKDAITTVAPSGAAASGKVCSLAGGQEWIDIYIWLEGNDSDCSNVVSGTGCTIMLTFGVIATTP